MLNEGRLQLSGEVEELLAAHRVLTGPASQLSCDAPRLAVVHARQAGAQVHVLVRMSAPVAQTPAGWQSDPATLEDLVLGYLRDPAVRMLPGLVMAPSADGSAVTP